MGDSADRDDSVIGIDRARLDGLFNHVDEMVVTCGWDAVVVYASPATSALLGYEPRQIEGRSIFDFVHPDEYDELAEALERWSDRSGVARGQPQRVRASDGTWVSVYYDITLTDGGGDGGALGPMTITLRPADLLDVDRRELIHRLLSEDRLVRLATLFLGSAPDEFEQGLDKAVTELSGLEWVTRVSIWSLSDGDQMVCRATWEAKADAPTTPLPPRIPSGGTPLTRHLVGGEEVHIRSVEHLPDDWQVDREALRMAGVQSLLAVPMVVRGESIGFVMVEVTIADIAFDVTQIATVRSAAAILASAFSRRESEQELIRRASTDVLTGLGNRWAFLDAVTAAQRDVAEGGSPGFAVALVDVDRFAVVNDAFGHDVGDRLIGAIAARLAHSTPRRSTLCRLHGDEFLVVVPGIESVDPAAAQVERLLDALRPPFDVEGRAVPLAVSAGIVFCTDTGVVGTELIQRADLVMQRTRETGGGPLGIEDQALHLGMAARIDLESELRAGLAEEQIAPHFQAEWDLVTGEIVAAEALARWEHPDGRLLEAKRFIPLAEECGIINELGDQVLRAACRAAAEWPDEVILRVNLSARQLHEVDVVGLVKDALAVSGLAPNRLCLELTESALLADPTHAIEVLDVLRADGVGLAIDDFGTGYSSLVYLKRLPVTSLKIDQSFVAGLPHQDDDRAIVRSVVQLADTLGLTATAEGVETAGQRECLLDLGCHLAQGYLLSRPEPVADFAARLASTPHPGRAKP
jgi:diguanylate cyclase (GGDEF)-like protein/PAS domain S-box-containing protein